MLERLVADGSDGVGDGHARQATAVIERRFANTRDGVGDGHARQAATVRESTTYCFSVNLD